MKIFIYISLLFVSVIGISQSYVQFNNKQTLSASSILPSVSFAFQENTANTKIRLENHLGSRLTNIANSTLFISPVINSSYYSANKQLSAYGGLNLEYSLNQKLFIRLNGIAGKIFGDSLQKTYDFNRAYSSPLIQNSNQFIDIHSRISYSPNKHFNFQVGIDDWFLGNGHRSLLLSDYGSSYPFASIKTKIWRFELLNLYQFLKENNNGIKRNKYTSTHYLSTKLGGGFNLSLFETVVFQPKDTLQNRGYELEYLNPILFYRPTEYALGSSDNVLLGLNINWKRKNFMIYGQFILDDFVLGEIRARSRWWANKYAGQIGFKGTTTIKSKPLEYQLELNAVRPFTYTHLSSDQNYAHNNFPLAHPAGANFAELFGSISYQISNNWNTELKFLIVERGANNATDSLSFGANIYTPYTLRPAEYGYHIGGNGSVRRYQANIKVNYTILPKYQLQAFVQSNLRYTVTAQSTSKLIGLYIGLRSNLWKDYSFDF